MHYRFGAYTLDTQCYELHHAGQRVPLRPKVFHVLAYLLAQRDRVVSKDELLAQVWPGQSLSDETLSSCIAAARRAVGDSGQAQQMIQTRQGHGYRFVAAVEVHEPAPDSANAFPAPPSSHPTVAMPSSQLERVPRTGGASMTGVRTSLVPPMPPGPALHQVPSPPRDFTGRTAELAALLTAVTQEGRTLCGLYGMGGIGKTALALTVTEHLTLHYPDAQLYLDLKGTSATPLSVAEAMAQVIHAYHPGEPLPSSDTALCGRYQSVLHGQRALMLLDNAASRAHVEPLIPPASCLLLVTARPYFTLPGLHAVRLTTLPPPEACAFVQTVAPRLGDAAASLAARCGYLPLALRVTASTVAEHPDLSPSAYVERLAETRQRLGLIDVSLSTSFALLPPVLQQQWCRVALFPSLFNAEAAATVLELDPSSTHEILSALVRLSLVEWMPETGYYRLHDLARVFAQSRLACTRERLPLDWARTQTLLGQALGVMGMREAATTRLAEAVQACQAALLEYTRERAPLDWARTQQTLGFVLGVLGQREGSTTRLEEAVQACQAALLEYTRERAPLDWARTQQTLGEALGILGWREVGTARLAEAVQACRAALLEYTRERVPLDWARTQQTMGMALWVLGQREAGTARLEEAVEACQAALLEGTRERAPLEWAWLQGSLGLVLGALGQRQAGPERLEEAVEACRAALLEGTRERAPGIWARTHHFLALALGALGIREAGTVRLVEAVAACRAALQECTRERLPLEWAWLQQTLGLTLGALGQREGSTAQLEEAVEACRAALLEYTQERVPLDWARTQQTLGFVLGVLGQWEGSTLRLEEAVQACRAALEVGTRERVPLDWARAQQTLGQVLGVLGMREAGTARLQEAVQACRAALEEVTRERVPLEWARTHNTLGQVLQVLGERQSNANLVDEGLQRQTAARRVFAAVAPYFDQSMENLEHNV